MNNKLLGIAFGGALTLAGLATGCSDTSDAASGAESALKGGKKAASADGGMARCVKAKKPKHDGGVKDGDDDTDESDTDTDADIDESAGDGGLGRGKGNGGKPADAGEGKGGGKPDDVGGGKPDDVGGKSGDAGQGKGGGKPDDVGGGKPDDVGKDKNDGGSGKSDEAKLDKDKGAKKCLEDDGTVGEEDEDESDAATHGQSGEHGKGVDNGKGQGKDADAGT